LCNVRMRRLLLASSLLLTLPLVVSAGPSDLAGAQTVESLPSAQTAESVPSAPTVESSPSAPTAESSPSAPTVESSPQAPPAEGWWPTFAHDQERTGRQPLSRISSQNVATLQLRWKYNAQTSFSSSPIIGTDSVYVGGTDGIVRALDLQSGKLLWKTTVGDFVRMTPALHDGTIFVGTRPTDAHVRDPRGTASFYAIDAATGTVKWARRSLVSTLRSEPVFVNGLVIEGLAGGDPPICHQGGVFALNEQDGTPVWKWSVSSIPDTGGAVWAPLSFDGHLVFFGTGNICAGGDQTYANGLVAMQPDGTLVWRLQFGQPFTDDDTGGALLVIGKGGFVPNKNGEFYAIDVANGTQRWVRKLTDVDGLGSFGTPSTDGTRILVSIGYARDPRATQPSVLGAYGGGIDAFDLDGNQLWQMNTGFPIAGYAAISNDLAFVEADASLLAIDVTSGKRVWSSQTATSSYASVYGSPALTDSKVVYADLSGTVYCFALGAPQ
jgi:outer membrane protein assembly factor BamB